MNKNNIMNKNTNSVTKLISHRSNLCLGYLFLAISMWVAILDMVR